MARLGRLGELLLWEKPLLPLLLLHEKPLLPLAPRQQTLISAHLCFFVKTHCIAAYIDVEIEDKILAF